MLPICCGDYVETSISDLGPQSSGCINRQLVWKFETLTAPSSKLSLYKFKYIQTKLYSLQRWWNHLQCSLQHFWLSLQCYPFDQKQRLYAVGDRTLQRLPGRDANWSKEVAGLSASGVVVDAVWEVSAFSARDAEWLGPIHAKRSTLVKSRFVRSRGRVDADAGVGPVKRSKNAQFLNARSHDVLLQQLRVRRCCVVLSNDCDSCCVE